MMLINEVTLFIRPRKFGKTLMMRMMDAVSDKGFKKKRKNVVRRINANIWFPAIMITIISGGIRR